MRMRSHILSPSVAPGLATPAIAMTILRSGFQAYGFDVRAFADSEISRAILAAANPDRRSSRDLYACAFERLQSQRSVNSAEPFSKSSVVFAMTFIRPMFEKGGWDLRPHSDDEIAEALLRTHLPPTTQWLSPEHLSSAYARLAPTQPRS